MKRAVIFDFGGVIFKTQDYRPRHKWDDRLNLPHGTVERIVHGSKSWQAAQRGEISVGAYWNDVATQLRVPVEVASGELARDFYSGDALDPDLMDIIRRLREVGHTVALLSNDCAALLRPRMERLCITKLFEPIIISSEIGATKPDAAIYEATLAALQRPADETIFIDDRQENVLAAQEMGIYGIHYYDNVLLWDAMKPLLEKEKQKE